MYHNYSMYVTLDDGSKAEWSTRALSPIQALEMFRMRLGILANAITDVTINRT